MKNGSVAGFQRWRHARARVPEVEAGQGQDCFRVPEVEAGQGQACSRVSKVEAGQDCSCGRNAVQEISQDRSCREFQRLELAPSSWYLM